LNPLLAGARNVEVILAVDASADTTENYPNGTSLITTARRSQLDLLNQSIKFPPIPETADVFVSQGYNVRPTFFGCNATSATDYPLVIYLPNAPTPGVTGYSTNTTTLTLEYSIEEASAFLAVAQENVFKGNQPDGQNRDSSWPDCLACGLMERKRQSAGVARSSQCQTCLERYCVSLRLLAWSLTRLIYFRCSTRSK
jgi:lysophospholipase